MRKKTFLFIAFLLAIAQGVWAQPAFTFEGEGTVSSPYLISSTADWQKLARLVNNMGWDYQGKYFKLTADIDANGVSVGGAYNETGTVMHAFSGIFDGDGHTLTYNRGGMDAEGKNMQVVNDFCAPFVRLVGATIRHLKVTGAVYSSHMHAAGIASLIDGSEVTTIDDCHVSSTFFAASSLSSDASFGGIVGNVDPTCKADPVIKNCSFTGRFQFYPTRSSGLVAYTNRHITFEHCLFDPQETANVDECATFVRTAPGVECTFKECYYTQVMGTEQGEPVFSAVEAPEGCTAEITSEPTIDFDGHKYWQNGATIRLAAPDDADFNHWETNFSCYINDPWQRAGTQVVRDVRRKPSFQYINYMQKPVQERTMDGTVYRYLSRKDYHLYLSDEVIAQKSYHFDDNGELFKWDADGNHVWITAVVGWEPGKIPSDGAQIHNDLSGWGKDYTFMGVIAPHAFEGCTELKTLYFKDTDANNYNARAGFDFIIGDSAFANCPNLTEIKMMQYTTEGDNHWEALKPAQVTAIGQGVFGGSPQAYFSTDIGEYQNYLGSTTWKDYQNRVIVYNHTNVDFTTNGAKYSYMRNTKGEALKNSNSNHSTLMETLRLWNADYQNFTASSLLATNDQQNIWYAYIVGCDDSYLKKNDGTLRIYNDPGSYYNYKTLAIGRNAFKGDKELKKIEFWQTNGRSENSYSDLKMVIQNGAFHGCTNLKELRMFYYVQDGDDHWEVLGPENVIPGDNIFGIPFDEMDYADSDEEERLYMEAIPADFKIIVSPDRYQDFIDDPNWMAYQQYIEPAEFNPNGSDMKDFSLGGLTYGYMTSPGGITQTSQTVSQDVSWWTFPRIAIEVAIDIASLGSAISSSMKTASAASAAMVEKTNTIGVLEEIGLNGTKNMFKKETIDFMNEFMASGVEQVLPEVLAKGGPHVESMVNLGFITEAVSEQGVVTRVMKSGAGFVEAFEAHEAKRFGAQKTVGDLVRSVAPTVNGYIIGMANTARDILQKQVSSALAKNTVKFPLAAAACGLATTSSYFSANLWGGSGSYNGDALQKGMKANILSNMHQVGMAGGGYVITTPQKNLCYHTYIKDVPASTTDAVIYAGTGKGQGRNNNARTTTMAKNAFRNHTNLKTVKFHETGIQSDEAMPMLFTIPDSAFVGCTNLQRFDLRVETENNGQQALGPENFILGGDSIFAGLDPAKFHIIIDPKRKQDFLDNESWKPLAPYFIYEEAKPKTQYQEYGGNYAYAYENGTTQKVNKVSGHKIEHTVVTGADNEFLNGHQGALKLCNDIGVWNNYQLDAVTKKAFMGNENLRVVSFTDLKGTGAYGDSYTGLQVALMDSCFADCKNLANLDLLYLVTDGDNHIDPIKPDQVTIGKGVLDGTKAQIKMLPQQVAWFEADTTWNKYKDRFLPCIIKPGDKGIKDALKPMAYYDMAHTGYDPTTWDDYIDLARIAGAGFSWLDGKFQEEKDEIRSFADFKHFESVGLDYVGKEWFRGCKKMTNIVLPKTIKTIGEFAFANCYGLQEIELPAALTEIGAEAFNDCPDLKTIRVLGKTPARFDGTAQFSKNAGLRIYVPDASVDAYKTAWADYKDYIVSDREYKVVNEVTLTAAGTLAEKLGLSVEWSYSGMNAGDEPRYLHGNYAKYDSLTVSGPLNDLDLWVIRYMAGNNGYNRGGVATDGVLRYLNLTGASIVKDSNCKAHYLNLPLTFMSNGWIDITDNNVLPPFLFYNCTALETIILPKSLKDMGARIFAGCSGLKRLAIPASLQDYDTKDYLNGLLDYPLEELVFVTDKPAVSDCGNPWEQEIGMVFTKQSQLTDYMNQPYLTRSARSVVALFEDDAVMETLAQKGHFFPSNYLVAETAENLFNDNTTIKTFDEFSGFSVKSLDRTFANASMLKRISLPDSLKTIGAEAFAGCSKLDTIRISRKEVPTLAQDAFKDLPADFRILVPKEMTVRYREQWAQYADHINVDQQNYTDSEWTVVTLDKPNTLAEKLGFEVNWDYRAMTVFSTKHNYINGVRGDYSKIRKLKVVGPISGSDFAFMRYLAGFCPWANCRNTMGRLEAIDLYDADIKKSDDLSAPDMFKVITHVGPSNVENDNELPCYAFLQAYNLKSLVLPKTCAKIKTRALQQCEALETLVLGDDLTDFDWSSLDDDAMLTRLYIMAKQKPKMDVDNWLVRQLYNNYNPTFDAFYVRPSLYNDYLSDRTYTVDLQRTNLISKGVFDDDDSYCAFAKHAAATQDDLGTVKNVEGWFDSHPAAKNLTPLKYTAIDTLKAATMAPLTQLEQIALPKTLKAVEKNAFQNNTKLRYVDMLLSNDADLMAGLRNGTHDVLGLNEQQTLVYVPKEYNNIGETNVIVEKAGQLMTQEFYLVDSLDYLVPHAFDAISIRNSRKLTASDMPYTVCLPYSMSLPATTSAVFRLSQRDGNKLVFKQTDDLDLQALQPYLLMVYDEKDMHGQPLTLDSYKFEAPQPIMASTDLRMVQDDAPGYSMRGTLTAISNKEAADLGAYILQSDGYWHPVGTANTKAAIPPYRAYLLPSARNARARISMTLTDDDTTGIDTIETIDRDGTHRYYDLQGRQIDPASAKGVVIKDGKKVVVK